MDTVNCPQIILHAHEGLDFTPFETKWVPHSARFVVLGQMPRATGAIQVHELERGKLKKLKSVEKPKGFKCGTFQASSIEDRHLATGDYDGRLQIWDLERLDAKPIFDVKAHEKIVNCIDGCGGLNIGGGAPEIVTGSRDGTVRVWDPRQPDPVLSLEPVDGEIPADCWTVAFGNSYNDSERMICAGYDNGDIKLFDLRTNMLRWDTNVKNGVCHVQFDRKDIVMNKLAVSTLESNMIIYDMRTYHPEEGYAGRTQKVTKSTVWGCHFLPQNREIFATAGGNGSVTLHKYCYPAERKVEAGEGLEKGVAGTVRNLLEDDGLLSERPGSIDVDMREDLNFQKPPQKIPTRFPEPHATSQQKTSTSPQVEMLNQKDICTQPIVSFDWHLNKEGLCVFASLDQSLRVGIVTKTNLF